MKMLLLLFCLCMPVLSATAEESGHLYDFDIEQQHDTKPRDFSNAMLTVKVMLTKLKELVFTLNDIHELEAIGMSSNDVEVMRSALLAKIQQTKAQTLLLIRRL